MEWVVSHSLSDTGLVQIGVQHMPDRCRRQARGRAFLYRPLRGRWPDHGCRMAIVGKWVLLFDQAGPCGESMLVLSFSQCRGLLPAWLLNFARRPSTMT